MFLGELTAEVTTLRGVGPVLAARLERLAVKTVRDLLLLLPRTYEDRTEIVALSEAARLPKACVAAAVVSVSELGRGWTKTVKAVVSDGSAEASLVCFGRRFLRGVLKPGRKFFVWGSFRPRFGELQCTDFELEPWSERPASFGKILPVYPLTEGLTQGALRKASRRALESAARSIESSLPESISAARGLPTTREALRGAHFPRDAAEADRCRSALAFEELFFFEAVVLGAKRRLAAPRKARTIDRGPMERCREALPFRLTADQRSVLAEIEADLGSTLPMARLLQGDVGCGKTLVALLSALLPIAAGEQAAFLAPTELLARQHARNAAKLLEPIGVRVGFLSGVVTGEARARLLASLRAGEIDLLIGTHALFSDEVAFRDLGLVIVDEQHKFGVLQRRAIMRKGKCPDLLLMTATPIPRTLALTAFGDLEVSTIRMMPAGRKPVITHLAREGNEEKVYRRVRQEIDRGRQAYFVYPLIGESDLLAAKDAESAFRLLRDEVYPDFSIGLIHSRVPEEEKERVMAGFVEGEVRILVATSVVEVGVDVANATCMIVEHAERFGLSTLHQLRGRVGRGADQSYAFLLYGSKLTEDGVERLKIMMESTDGFRIAERDMELRGPGELLGLRQSGFLNFRAADLLVHGALLQAAREEAARLLREDPDLLAPENSAVARSLAGDTSAPWPPAVSIAALQGG